MKNKRINEIYDKHPFFCNSFSMGFTIEKFEIDFKSISTQSGLTNEQVSSLSHKVIFMSPMGMKLLLGTIKNMVANYEKKNGIIEIPKEISNAIKENNKEIKIDKSIMNYLG